MERFWIFTAGCVGAAGVAAGAFGAHGLEKLVAAEVLAIWETGADYQLFHAGPLLGAAFLVGRAGGGKRLAGWACWAFLIGIVVFSGSLYLLVLTGMKWWGAVTPIGGVSLIAGWVLLAMAGWKTTPAGGARQDDE